MKRLLGAALVGFGLALLGALALAAPRARLLDPTPTLRLVDRNGAFLGEVGEGTDERLGFWPVSALPERVVAATLAVEDRRLHSHPGVDLRAIGRALQQNLQTGRRVSGASTVPMQVARLQDPGPRTWGRKAVEGLTALLLVDRYGKTAVLEQYLRLAPYGNNVHGVAYAARRYFDKPVDDLSWAQTAFLASIPQSPSRMNPYEPAGRARAVARAERVLDQLRADGALSATDHAQAHAELRALHIPPRPTRPDAALHPVLALEAQLRAGARPADPIVRTTLDLDQQRWVQSRLAATLGRLKAQGAGNLAAVLVAREDLSVRAAVGSADWYDVQAAGAIDFTRTPRYPGSTLKPLYYAAALDAGLLHPGQVLDDLRHGPEGIGNADGRFVGPLLPRHALAASRNVPAVQVARGLGAEGLYDLYRRLGLHKDQLPAGHYGMGLAIGGMPVTLLDLVGAWTALADDGRRRRLRFLASEPLDPGEPVLSPYAAGVVRQWLSDPVARVPAFPRLGHTELPFPAAIKTGTSPDYRDAWTVAITERWIVGVWIGEPDWRPMNGLSGYRGAASVVHGLLMGLHADEARGLSDRGFPDPEGAEAVEICALSGGLAGPDCASVVRESFLPSAVPAHACAWHRRVAGPGGSTRVALDPPPAYRAWAAQAGLPLAEPLGGLTPRDAPAVRVVRPTDGLRLVHDPNTPAALATLALEATVEPAVPQLVWWVDGAPWAIVDAPYTVRWPITPGEHTFEARVPHVPGGSRVVKVGVR